MKKFYLILIAPFLLINLCYAQSLPLAGGTMTGTITTDVTATTPAIFHPVTTNGDEATPYYETLLQYGNAGTGTYATIFGGNAFNATNGTYLQFRVNNRSAVNSPINALTISGYGNVGIGTTAPLQNLNVTGVSAPANTGAGTDGIFRLNTGTGLITDNALVFGIHDSGDYSWVQSVHPGTAFTNLILNASGGNVGIGTTSPFAKLEVNSGSASAGVLDVYSTASSFTSQMGTGTLNLGTNSIGNDIVDAQVNGISETVSDSGYGALAFATRTIGSVTEKMRITSNGNVLINQTSQTNSSYKLDVAGYARANEIVVNLSGADFVFAPQYKLPKLTTLKSYVYKNHHLPEIASADEMNKNGVALGELNTKLLQKVEELTLYLIQQKERNDAQQKQLTEQQKVNRSLRKRIDKLEVKSRDKRPAK